MNENILQQWLTQQGIQQSVAEISSYTVIIAGILFIAFFVTWLVNRTFLPAIVKLAPCGRV